MWVVKFIRGYRGYKVIVYVYRGGIYYVFVVFSEGGFDKYGV